MFDGVALVTGAGSGLGQLMSWRLAAAGVTVAAVDVSEEGLARTARRAPQVRPHVVDVTDEAAVRELVAGVEADLGPIGRLVNAAAIAPTRPLLDQPMDEIRRLVEINYLGLASVTKTVVPAMVERRRGQVVQFASLAGWLPTPHFGAYSASKFAVVAFSETLAHELEGSGVHLVCVCPPIVDTPLLEQIASRPPGFETMPPIRPEVVIDAIEQSLDRRELWCFPGRGTSTLWRLRRFAPEVLWRRLDALGTTASAHA